MVQLTSNNEGIVREAINVLRELAIGIGIKETKYGLCYNLFTTLRIQEFPRPVINEVGNMIKVAFMEWPLCSGDRAYPVPGGKARYFNTADKWVGENGNRRKELCVFCADYLEKLLAEENHATI